MVYGVVLYANVSAAAAVQMNGCKCAHLDAVHALMLAIFEVPRCILWVDHVASGAAWSMFSVVLHGSHWPSAAPTSCGRQTWPVRAAAVLRLL